jgi:hypothetical protein
MAHFRVMSSLILKRASASRPSGEWNDDDYVARRRRNISWTKGSLWATFFATHYSLRQLLCETW